MASAAGLAGATTLAALVVSLWTPNARTADEVVLGTLSNFPPGSVTRVGIRKVFDGYEAVPDQGDGRSRLGQQEIMVSHLPQDGILALSTRLPHTCRPVLIAQARPTTYVVGEGPRPLRFPPGAVLWEPCHYETFDAQGECVAGPCRVGLNRFAVSISGNEVILRLGRVFPGPLRGARYRPGFPQIVS